MNCQSLLELITLYFFFIFLLFDGSWLYNSCDKNMHTCPSQLGCRASSWNAIGDFVAQKVAGSVFGFSAFLFFFLSDCSLNVTSLGSLPFTLSSHDYCSRVEFVWPLPKRSKSKLCFVSWSCFRRSLCLTCQHWSSAASCPSRQYPICSDEWRCHCCSCPINLPKICTSPCDTLELVKKHLGH